MLGYPDIICAYGFAVIAYSGHKLGFTVLGGRHGSKHPQVRTVRFGESELCGGICAADIANKLAFQMCDLYRRGLVGFQYNIGLYMSAAFKQFFNAAARHGGVYKEIKLAVVPRQVHQYIFYKRIGGNVLYQRGKRAAQFRAVGEGGRKLGETA